MRDGSEVRDPRLGRLKQVDLRSLNYLVSAAPEVQAATRLRPYTWAISGGPLDQGHEGSCTGHALAHDIMARPAAIPFVNQDEGHRYAVACYYRAQQGDPWEGGEYPGANPVYGGTSTLAIMEVGRSLGLFPEYRWAMNAEELALGVGYFGPAIIGIDWTEGMANPTPDGIIEPTGELLGGHCIIVYGVDVRRRLFKLLNSWGNGWGLFGMCLVPWDAMDELLVVRKGEAALPRFRKRMAAPPLAPVA